ncbi:MAG TPA: PilX N-terminal domain-containing pilus assembly protein [candidate division Zixibacteria bacterium]|nr:PilX N-terminal domain-containing pilus assembly protein [candidate division Zixibacteria bacterium]
MFSKSLTNERGVAAFIALVLVLMLTLLGLAALSTSDDEVDITGNHMHEMRAFYAAEAGLERAAARLQTAHDTLGGPPSGPFPVITYDTLNGCGVLDSVDDNGPATIQVLTNGTLAGLNALVKSYSITSVAENLKDPGRVVLSQYFESALIPLFQFAVFYGNDLEIAPGPAMSLIGRVHSNGNLYLQSDNTLRMDSYVTASGEIYHGRKGPGGTSYGDVQIKNSSGDLVSMNQSGDWIDANNTNWYDTSTILWEGRVRDSNHGQGELNLPLSSTAGGDAHSLIERSTSNPDSYEDKDATTLKFIDRRAYYRSDATQAWTDVTDTMVALGVITFTDNAFTDQREGSQVDVMDLDVEAAYDEGFISSSDETVIYYSDVNGDYPALRLTNGDELDAGLTVASENPVYTWGDYNSVDKKPASILADAVTFLSDNWVDYKSTWNKYSRPASETTVNVCYLTGNTETTSSSYNGGFENLPRFLENWTGVNFNWKGSAVNLWNSHQANGSWGSIYYNPPNRNWQYDTMLDNPDSLPPETPALRVFQRTGWQQHYVGYEEEDWYANSEL